MYHVYRYKRIVSLLFTLRNIARCEKIYVFLGETEVF